MSIAPMLLVRHDEYKLRPGMPAHAATICYYYCCHYYYYESDGRDEGISS